MWFVNVAQARIFGNALHNESLYHRAIDWAARKSTTLPSSGGALSILESIDPRPDMTLQVPARQWPQVPEFDISIIVPCYNAAEYIEPCMQSIISQENIFGAKKIEIVCIDDGSTDATGEILERIASNMPNDRLEMRVIHQANGGHSIARNTGIANAHGSTFIFVDSDDLLLPDAVATLAGAYAEGGCDYVTASYENMSADGHTRSKLGGKRQFDAPWARIYSREVWRNLEFPVGLWYEDAVQCFCIDSRWRERYVDVPVYLYRRNRGGITTTSRKSKKSLDSLWIVEELLCWCQQLGIPFDQTLYEQLVWQFGRLLLWRTTALNERERQAMFVHACDLLDRWDPNKKFSTEHGERWRNVEQALRSRHYPLWKIAATGQTLL